MTTFTLTEGDDILDRIGDDFIKLYNDGVKVSVICQRLNITRTQFQNLRQRLVRRGLITTKRNKNGGRKPQKRYQRDNPKNYHNRQAKMFKVVYRMQYYGCFKKEEHAKRFVELMRECNWDINKKNELKKEVLMNG